MKGSDKSFKSFFNFTVFNQFFSCAAVSFGSFCPAHELSVMCREKTARNKVFKVLFFFLSAGCFSESRKAELWWTTCISKGRNRRKHSEMSRRFPDDASKKSWSGTRDVGPQTCFMMPLHKILWQVFGGCFFFRFLPTCWSYLPAVQQEPHQKPAAVAFFHSAVCNFKIRLPHKKKRNMAHSSPWGFCFDSYLSCFVSWIYSDW